MQNCWLIMWRADPALCSRLFASLAPALVTHDIWESNLFQTCSWARTGKDAWGILPAWRAYKVGKIIIPCICSSFSRAFVAGSVSNHSGHPTNHEGYRSGANHSPAVLGDWQVSCVRHALANKSAVTHIQNTDWARMNYTIFKFTVCLSLKKKKKRDPIFPTQSLKEHTKRCVQTHAQGVDGMTVYNRKAGATHIS